MSDTSIVGAKRVEFECRVSRLRFCIRRRCKTSPINFPLSQTSSRYVKYPPLHIELARD